VTSGGVGVSQGSLLISIQPKEDGRGAKAQVLTTTQRDGRTGGKRLLIDGDQASSGLGRERIAFRRALEHGVLRGDTRVTRQIDIAAIAGTNRHERFAHEHLAPFQPTAEDTNPCSTQQHHGQGDQRTQAGTKNRQTYRTAHRQTQVAIMGEETQDIADAFVDAAADETAEHATENAIVRLSAVRVAIPSLAPTRPPKTAQPTARGQVPPPAAEKISSPATRPIRPPTNPNQPPYQRPRNSLTPVARLDPVHGTQRSTDTDTGDGAKERVMHQQRDEAGCTRPKQSPLSAQASRPPSAPQTAL